MKKTAYLLLAAAAMAFTACSDEKEYVPVDPDAPDCMGVYFDSDNETDFIFVPGEPAEITIKMHRLNTTAAADVPLIASTSTTGFSVPASVYFEAGSADAEITVDCSDLPIREQARLKIDLPDQYINHYAETHFNYETTALVSQWESANTDGSPVTFYFTDTDYSNYNSKPNVVPSCFQPLQADMEVLPGAGIFRVHNFLNSGSTVSFQLTPSPYADFEGEYRVSPRDYYFTMAEAYESDDYGDSWYNPWYLLDPDEDYCDLILTSLDGQEVSFSYPYIYWYSDSYAYEYSYARLKEDKRAFNSVSMGLMGTVGTNDITLPSYFYVFFTWDGNSGL